MSGPSSPAPTSPAAAPAQPQEWRLRWWLEEDGTAGSAVDPITPADV